jgi:hypothetical protein
MNNIVMLSQVPQMYKLLNYIKSNNTNIIDVLDPMTTIFRLCLLNFKRIGTKISIYPNKVSTQDAGFFQGMIRWTKGDQRNDLHKLETPIKKSLIWYVPEIDSNLKFIFKLASKGMIKLQKSYKAGTARISLEHYSNLINTSILQKKISSDIDNESEEDNIIYIRIKDLWTKRQIQIMYDLLKQITEEKNISQRKYYIKATERILDGKDKRLLEIIDKITC